MSFLRAQLWSITALAAVIIAYAAPGLLTPAEWEPYASNVASLVVWYWLISCAIVCTIFVSIFDKPAFMVDKNVAKLIGTMAGHGRALRWTDGALDLSVAFALAAVGNFWMALLGLLVFGMGRAAYAEADKGMAIYDSVAAANARATRPAGDDTTATTFAPLKSPVEAARDSLKPGRDMDNRRPPDRFAVHNFGGSSLSDNPRDKKVTR